MITALMVATLVTGFVHGPIPIGKVDPRRLHPRVGPVHHHRARSGARQGDRDDPARGAGLGDKPGRRHGSPTGCTRIPGRSSVTRNGCLSTRPGPGCSMPARQTMDQRPVRGSPRAHRPVRSGLPCVRRSTSSAANPPNSAFDFPAIGHAARPITDNRRYDPTRRGSGLEGAVIGSVPASGTGTPAVNAGGPGSCTHSRRVVASVAGSSARLGGVARAGDRPRGPHRALARADIPQQ